MKKTFLTLALLLASGAAFAQVNVVPAPGVTTAYVPRTTYSAGFIGLVPAASATDVICIAGSASRAVRLQNIRLSGSAGTLVSLPITLVRRVSVDTGGTAATTTANPANNIAKRDINSPTATATLVSYTANPTIVDSAPTYLDSQSTTFGTTAAATVTVPLFLDYAKDVENFLFPPTLVGVAAQACLNFNAVTISSGLLNGSITWTEE